MTEPVTTELAWTLVQDLVDGEDRRGELTRTLGFGLGGGRWKALAQLRGGPRTLRQVADALGIDAPYATVLVDKLEAHGLVERHPHPDDRRRKLVALTPAGEEAVATADAIWARPAASLASLTHDDLADLVAILSRLRGSEQVLVR